MLGCYRRRNCPFQCARRFSNISQRKRRGGMVTPSGSCGDLFVDSRCIALSISDESRRRRFYDPRERTTLVEFRHHDLAAVWMNGEAATIAMVEHPAPPVSLAGADGGLTLLKMLADSREVFAKQSSRRSFRPRADRRTDEQAARTRSGQPHGRRQPCRTQGRRAGRGPSGATIPMRPR